MFRYVNIDHRNVVIGVFESENEHYAEHAHIIKSDTAQMGQQLVGDVFEDYTPTIEDLAPVYEQAIQDHINMVARANGYDSIYTAISYIGSINPKWNAEGLALRNWRDACWLAVHDLLNGYVESGHIITPEEAITSLPEYVKPE